MSSINKIHVNGATTLSLNDRFTIMQKVGDSNPRRRSRSRSRSRARPANVVTAANPRVSLRNRNLLAQLEQRHKMRAALKIKRRSLKAKPTAIGVKARRLVNRSSANIVSAVADARRQVKRSLRRVATSKAGVLGNAIGGGRRRLNRNNTNGSILDRLGVRGRSRTRQAGAKQRASSRGRSASRNRLQRTSSRQNLTNGQQRGRSATRQKRGVSASLQQRAQSRQRAQPRQRSQSRARNIANAALQQNRRKLIRRRSRSNLRKVTSVNSRLGVRGPNAANNVARAKTAGKLVRRGRVAKPRRGNVRNQVLTGGRQQPVKRSRSRARGRQVGVRNVSRARNVGKNQQKKPQQQQQGSVRRGRSRTRNRGGRPAGKPNKDELDKELDQYMDHSKSSINAELGI